MELFFARFNRENGKENGTDLLLLLRIMNLYTVTIDFEDRTKAIIQVEGADQVVALKKVLRESEALEGHDKSAIEETMKKRDGFNLHICCNLRILLGCRFSIEKE